MLSQEIKIGERLVVYGRLETSVTIKDIIIDNDAASTILILNWENFGE